MNDTIERSQTHATFVIERAYPQPVERVWRALSDNDARDQWFGAGEAFGVHFDGLDSVEGREEGSQGLLDQLGSYLSAGH